MLPRAIPSAQVIEALARLPRCAAPLAATVAPVIAAILQAPPPREQPMLPEAGAARCPGCEVLH